MGTGQVNILGLVCPVTKLPLTKISDGVPTTTDGKIGYPINDQIPILLGPEAITDKPWSRDLKSPQYAEAYIGPITQKRVMQIGGSGVVALMMLLAGASEAIFPTNSNRPNSLVHRFTGASG
jgi:uncharacterized protein YbaR (Trm112 family)